MNRSDASRPLISIVTITYNAAGVLEPTLESLASQNFRDFEHLVIDGHSSDNTLALVRRLSPASRILSEPDGGLYDAMNKGLRMARGRYILFLNAGDSLHAVDTLHRYALAAVALPCPDIIYGDTIIVDKDRQFIAPRHKSAPERLDFNSFKQGMLVCHQSFMVRRELAPEYNLAYRFSADYDWTLRCIQASDPEKNINLHAVVTDYLSDGLTDKNHRKSLMERFDIMRRHYGLLTTLRSHFRFLIH